VTFKLSGNGIAWLKINAPNSESESHTSYTFVVVKYKSGATPESNYINKYKYIRKKIFHNIFDVFSTL